MATSASTAAGPNSPDPPSGIGANVASIVCAATLARTLFRGRHSDEAGTAALTAESREYRSTGVQPRSANDQDAPKASFVAHSRSLRRSPADLPRVSPCDGQVPMRFAGIPMAATSIVPARRAAPSKTSPRLGAPSVTVRRLESREDQLRRYPR